MALKAEVVDRVPTYPGRVKLTPVSGQTNVYDMSRADSPVKEGTPINKALFDQKAYTLTEGVTVYVSTSGSDTTGTGASSAPYRTVQKAIDSLPKCLGGFHAQIDIAAGTYEERVTVDGFYGGRLTIGVTGRTVTLRGISVMSSSGVRINISNLTYSASYAGTLLYADYGSDVTVLSGMTVRGGSATGVSGVSAARGSLINAPGVTIALLNCGSAAVYATSGSKIVLGTVEGNSNTSYGLRADLGGLITYNSKNLTATAGDSTGSGGRLLTGSGTAMANASVE
jgi:hypothetical protein